jgi:hypothetical protein
MPTTLTCFLFADILKSGHLEYQEGEGGITLKWVSQFILMYIGWLIGWFIPVAPTWSIGHP